MIDKDALSRMTVSRNCFATEKFHALPDQTMEAIEASRNGNTINPGRVNYIDQEHPCWTTYGRDYNCQNCAVAFEMACRGYDVIAKPMLNGSNVGNMEKYFVGGRLIYLGEGFSDEVVEAISIFNNLRLQYKSFRKKHKGVRSRVGKKYHQAMDSLMTEMSLQNARICQRMRDYILRMPDGARGILITGYVNSLDRRTNRFHARNWVKKTDDEIGFVVYDAQDYDRTVKDFMGLDATEMYNMVDMRDIYFMRTDNLELTSEIRSAVITRSLAKDIDKDDIIFRINFSSEG